MKKLMLLAMMLFSVINLNAIGFYEDISDEHMDININYMILEPNTIFVTISAKNKYKNAKGGLSISIPEAKSTNIIKEKYANGFKDFKAYKEGSKIWNATAKAAVPSKYLLVEGWSNDWKKNEKKSISITIDTKNISSLNLQVRSNLTVNKEKLATPLTGELDQQDYAFYNVNLPIKELTSKLSKYSISSETKSMEGKNDMYYMSTLFLVDNETKEKKKLLTKKYEYASFFQCEFANLLFSRTSKDMIANFSCDGSTTVGLDSLFYISAEGKELKRVNNYQEKPLRKMNWIN